MTRTQRSRLLRHKCVAIITDLLRACFLLKHRGANKLFGFESHFDDGTVGSIFELCGRLRGLWGKLFARDLLIRVTNLCVEIFVGDHLVLRDMSSKNSEPGVMHMQMLSHCKDEEA